MSVGRALLLNPAQYRKSVVILSVLYDTVLIYPIFFTPPPPQLSSPTKKLRFYGIWNSQLCLREYHDVDQVEV